ncbi:hypothetical protein LZ30DRAFT_725755 [Colletotrichum cereale]|nr:hypothetical protein LZ30DRAFT_725755 [Colletotrichum cereale]
MRKTLLRGWVTPPWCCCWCKVEAATRQAPAPPHCQCVLSVRLSLVTNLPFVFDGSQNLALPYLGLSTFVVIAWWLCFCWRYVPFGVTLQPAVSQPARKERGEASSSCPNLPKVGKQAQAGSIACCPVPSFCCLHILRIQTPPRECHHTRPDLPVWSAYLPPRLHHPSMWKTLLAHNFTHTTPSYD